MLGYSDSEYKRFTSGTKSSLIVGTSRSAQGIVPEVVNAKLAPEAFDLPIYNFSFNVGTSPYGETYYKAIKKKLQFNPDTTSLFIVSVDPFSLSTERGQDAKGFREDSRCLKRVRVYTRPQLWYMLLYCRPHQWVSNHSSILHEDGWLEVNGIMMDSLSIDERLEKKMTEYEQYEISSSSYRLEWLRATVELMKQNGSVFMCRIPVSNEMQEWEDQCWPDFDEDMNAMAREAGIEYYSFSSASGQYRTTDGNHLYYEDGKIFTSMLCDSILTSGICRKNRLQ